MTCSLVNLKVNCSLLKLNLKLRETFFSEFVIKGHVTRGNVFATPCNAMALHFKLQGRLPRVTPHVCN